jgi:hypothetical protein
MELDCDGLSSVKTPFKTSRANFAYLTLYLVLVWQNAVNKGAGYPPDVMDWLKKSAVQN